LGIKKSNCIYAAVSRTTEIAGISIDNIPGAEGGANGGGIGLNIRAIGSTQTLRSTRSGVHESTEGGTAVLCCG
jgi:hypothetical protein